MPPGGLVEGREEFFYKVAGRKNCLLNWKFFKSNCRVWGFRYNKCQNFIGVHWFILFHFISLYFILIYFIFNMKTGKDRTKSELSLDYNGIWVAGVTT